MVSLEDVMKRQFQEGRETSGEGFSQARMHENTSIS
jgi:hypothetical protein